MGVLHRLLPHQMGLRDVLCPCAVRIGERHLDALQCSRMYLSQEINPRSYGYESSQEKHYQYVGMGSDFKRKDKFVFNVSKNEMLSVL